MSVAERLENGFIFKFGRVLPLTLAVLACLALVASIFGSTYSLIPPEPAVEPAPFAEPPGVSITEAAVAVAVAEQIAASGGQGDTELDTAEDTVAEASEGARQVATALNQLRAALPLTLYAWTDESRTVCRQRIYGICLGERQQLIRKGVYPVVGDVIALHDDPGTEAERVVIPDVKLAYDVNGSNAAKKVEVLTEARTIVEAQPVEQRGAYIEAWASLRTEQEMSRQAAISLELSRISSERASELARFESETAEKKAIRTAALVGGGSALAALWTIALALALLAIERNTRVLGNGKSASVD